VAEITSAYGAILSEHCYCRPNVSTLMTQSGHRRGDEIDLHAFNAETFFGVALVGPARTGRFYSPLGKVGHREAGTSLAGQNSQVFDSGLTAQDPGALQRPGSFQLYRIALGLAGTARDASAPARA
jgi:hypothetical protein